MKKLLLSALLFASLSTVQAEDELYILNLSDNTDITYNELQVWDGVYKNEDLRADGFIFSHTAPYGDGYYEGFIASYNADNDNHYDSAGWTANQWGCMAQGGVNDASGHNPSNTATPGKPFLINYYSSYSNTTNNYGTSYFTMENLSTFTPVGLYVCNSPWGYYGCISGDGFAQPLQSNQGYYKITFNGVNTATGLTTSVDFFLAERCYRDRNADGIINEYDNYTNEEWSWCDLSEMGNVNLIYITMDSSDKGQFGMNTSTLACLDGIVVATPAGVNTAKTTSNEIYAANDYLYLTLDKAQEVIIYNHAGLETARIHAAAGTTMHALHHLAHGVYFVKHNEGCSKIVK